MLCLVQHMRQVVVERLLSASFTKVSALPDLTAVEACQLKRHLP